MKKKLSKLTLPAVALAYGLFFAALRSRVWASWVVRRWILAEHAKGLPEREVSQTIVAFDWPTTRAAIFLAVGQLACALLVLAPAVCAGRKRTGDTSAFSAWAWLFAVPFLSFAAWMLLPRWPTLALSRDPGTFALAALMMSGATGATWLGLHSGALATRFGKARPLTVGFALTALFWICGSTFAGVIAGAHVLFFEENLKSVVVWAWVDPSGLVSVTELSAGPWSIRTLAVVGVHRLPWLGLAFLAAAWGRWSRPRDVETAPAVAAAWSGERAFTVVLGAMAIAVVQVPWFWQLRHGLSSVGDRPVSGQAVLLTCAALVVALREGSNRKAGAALWATVGLGTLLSTVTISVLCARSIPAAELRAMALWIAVPRFICWTCTGLLVLAATASRRHLAVTLSLTVLALSAGSLLGETPLGPWLDLVSFPALRYSAVNGFGPGVRLALWLLAYRLALTVAVCGWIFGRKAPVPCRRWPVFWRTAMVVAAGVASATAGWNARNVRLANVGGEFTDLVLRGMASFAFVEDHETFFDVRQPLVTSVKLHLEITANGAVSVEGSYQLVNPWLVSLRQVAVALAPEAQHLDLRWDGWLAAAHADGYRELLFDLGTPLAPGGTARLTFAYQFADQQVPTWAPFGRNVALLGSRRPSEMADLFPVVGADPVIIPTSQHWRKGKKIRDWDADVVRARSVESPDAKERIPVEVVVSTDASWTAVAQGGSLREQVADGRRTTVTSGGAALPKELAVGAGNYQHAAADDRGTGLQALVGAGEEPAAAGEVLSLLRSAFDADVDAFGPYPWETLNVVELAADQFNLSGQSFPSVIAVADFNLALRSSSLPELRLELQLIIAHEVAHQWWPMSIREALTLGDSLKSALAQKSGPGDFMESVVEAIALRQVQSTVDPRAFRARLKLLRQNYFALCGFSPEPVFPELTDDTCAKEVVFAKCALGLFTLGDAFGVERFNSALRALREHHGPQTQQPLTLWDLLYALAPPENHESGVELKDLLTRALTYRNQAVSARQTKAEIQLTVMAHRFEGGAGPERHEIAEKSYLPIGGLDCRGQPHILVWQWLEPGKPTELLLTLPADTALAWAGIDPVGELLDDGEVNLVRVEGGPKCSLLDPDGPR